MVDRLLPVDIFHREFCIFMEDQHHGGRGVLA